MHLIEKYKTDIVGYIFYYLRFIRNGLIKQFWTRSIYLFSLLNKIHIGRKCSFSGRTRIVRTPESHISIGKKCKFKSYEGSNLIGINRNCILFTMNKNAMIKIGNHCGFSGTVISSASEVIIEDYVLCGANVLITDSDWHQIAPDKRRDKEASGHPIKICTNVWIGANSAILKGVTIGKNSVIGINSVVSRDIPENCIAIGNPCQIVKKIKKNEN